MTQTRITDVLESAVARLDHWLDTMRGPTGYGGPVVHWWRDCLLFCGPGHDWRYEGIIDGYLTLFQRTGQHRWLQKARRAGDDLVESQLASGHYPDSRFELNPGVAGTPHEAAADVGLLLLARASRNSGQDDWQKYLQAAEKNLTSFYLERLWCESEQRFRDDVYQPSFVPNKAATLLEALCLQVALTGREEYLQRYVRPTAEAILSHQVRAPGSQLHGGIAQNTVGRSLVEKYFPSYNARCVPGLLAAHQWLGDHRYLDAAVDAMAFLLRWRDPDGGFPQVVYHGGRVNRYPRWTAAVGDVLRAADLLRPYGLEVPTEPTLGWLLAGQLPSGGIASAQGFGAQVSQSSRQTALPEFRDLLPVCGWADKAFRYLATQVRAVPEVEESGRAALLSCAHRGRAADLIEDEHAIVLRCDGQDLYTWRKGTRWAQLAAPWVVTV